MFAAGSDEDVLPRVEPPREARSRSPPQRWGEQHPRSIQWHEWLRGFVAQAGMPQGQQARKLIIESMFTGMNPIAWSLAHGGIDVDDLIGAECKEHARAFMRKNRVMPKQCYKDVIEMSAAGLAPSQPGYVRADIFVAGFPCQPYSSQARKKLEPTKHPLYKYSGVTFDHILHTRPRVALLENIVGFAQVADYFGAMRSGLDLMQEKLGPVYHIGWSRMNLSTWLDCSRPRLYIWLIAKDVGTSADCGAIGRQIRLLESSRPERFCARVEDFMFKCGSDEWRRRVQLDLQCRGSLAVSRAVRSSTKGEQKAQGHIRSLTPVGAGRLMGLTGTPRQQAMYQALVAARCAAKGCDATLPGSRASALEGFKWDFSQNLPATRLCSQAAPSEGCSEVDPVLSRAVLGPLACMVRGSLPFSFEHDRVVMAEEMLRSHGWQIGAAVPDCSEIKDSDLQDLVGEMQAVQTLSAVVWSTLAVLAPKLSGLFAHT